LWKKRVFVIISRQSYYITVRFPRAVTPTWFVGLLANVQVFNLSPFAYNVQMDQSTYFHHGLLGKTMYEHPLFSRTRAHKVMNENNFPEGPLVVQIYENVAKQLSETVHSIGTPEEIAIFDAENAKIRTPHLAAKYQYVDRNDTSEERLTKAPSKIDAGLLVAQPIIPDKIFQKAAMDALMDKVPVDDEGFPLMVMVDEDICDPTHVTTGAARTKGGGDMGLITNAPVVKTQTFQSAAKLANHILCMFALIGGLVPIIPHTMSPKTENQLVSKQQRYFMMEDFAMNLISQIIHGHHMDMNIATSLNQSFNGLQAGCGILSMVIARQLSAIGIDIILLEAEIEQLLESGMELADIIRFINTKIRGGSIDYTNYEYHHGSPTVTIVNMTDMMYYWPMMDVQFQLKEENPGYTFAKAMAGSVEIKSIIEAHVGSGKIIRPRPAVKASGELLTLVGNGDINKTNNSFQT
jgi:hypothetical protein